MKHRLWHALFDELPPVGAVWPQHERESWLRCAQAIADWLHRHDGLAVLLAERWCGALHDA